MKGLSNYLSKGYEVISISEDGENTVIAKQDDEHHIHFMEFYQHELYTEWLLNRKELHYAMGKLLGSS